ncbi:hemin uptake protein HemP [Limnohabitans sp. MORI2]|uniref:hemin uptake protein HemP n=1 Tax=Limnohabitans sp. MORI2 TaxID=1751150 RepID=UPI002491454A|nr:hemin uptake protein HemP [Limnohabitans sp. MORI2]
MTTHKPPHPVNAGPSNASPASGQLPRTVDSQDLLGSQGVLYIRHQNEVYRLQTTRFGKLILTK